ncbi:MAG: L-serine ammonia-lyase, iron-sulfur-dependent, subunit alpha [Lachnospiraceae bacterium]|nr:L-serine ammonia-lyase, iron-sulfur-dependent, subunit alpha [Lachnospiraceae bacterium]
MKGDYFYPDIFNDVFGPVMQPGSSSHTAGPCRIGYEAYSVLGEKPDKITVILDKNGSFAGTFGHMNEDLGMLAGAYGLLPDDERQFTIKDILWSEQIDYEFIFGVIDESSHANAVKFILEKNNKKKITLVGNSTGGGMIEIVNVDGYQVAYFGEKDISVYDLILKTGSTDIPPDEKYREYRLTHVLPVHDTDKRKKQLFDSVTGWIEYAEKNNKNLFEAAIDYEIAFTGWSKEEITDRLRLIVETMHNQCTAVSSDDSRLVETPFSGYHFRQWKDYREKEKIFAGSIIDKALYYAFRAQTMSKGVPIVPGPMGNGGGYIYSVLRAAADENPKLNDKLYEGIAIAGIIGVICYTRTSPTGEVIGCTGECGMCASMATAGLTYIRGGSPEEVEAAASLTLQATIGWPCDPIPGGDNQPCTSRIIAAVTMAVAFSDVALSGRKAVLPYHEVVDIADKVGRALPDGCKCTSCGGLCLAPTALKSKEAFEEWRKGEK